MSNHDLVVKTEKLSQCSQIWDEIFPQTPSRSPFLSYGWFYALCNNLLKDEPEIFVFWDEDRPVGIFPGIVEDKTFRFIQDRRVTDICDGIYISDYEYQFMKSFSAFITENDWHVDLFPLKDDSAVVRFLPELLGDVIIEKADVSPILYLPGTWNSYLNRLGGKRRHELRRKMKKAGNVSLKDVESGEIEMLFRLMTASSDEKRNFLDDEVRSFFQAIADYFSEKRWLRFRAAFIDSKPIGTIFSFYYDNCIFLYNMGIDPDYYSISPGIITIALDIKSAISEGIKSYDFLRGNERYKFSLGAEERFTMRVRR